MKKIICVLLFLVVVFGLCLWNIRVVSDKVSAMIEIIEQCEALAKYEDAEAARELLLEVKDLWEKDEVYFCTMLRHSETDEIYTTLRITLSALDAGDVDDFLCHCSELKSHLELIRETERYTVGNIL